MLKINRLRTFIFALFISNSWINAQHTPADSTLNLPFINKEINIIQYNDSKAFAHFANKWFADSSQQISIAHFGDSHIQPDQFTGYVRKQLQAAKGNGGRGMVFPYSIAHTYSQSDYKSAFTGKWFSENSIHEYPKSALGVSGFMAQTSDSTASFSFYFKEKQDSGNRIIKLYYKQLNSFDIQIKTKNYIDTIVLNKALQHQPYVEILLPEAGDTLEFRLLKTQSSQTEFVLYGISIENTRKGLIYHNLGIGGSTFGSILKQRCFSEQFPSLNADLVILDWGTNDFLYKNIVPEKMEQTIIETIEKVRAANPTASIMLTSTHDMNRKKRNITAAKDFAELVKRIALEHNCLFYDWYWVSGGPYAMNFLEENNLGRKDNIHLTKAGYQLKGELFTSALLFSLNTYNTNNEAHKPLIVSPEIYASAALRNDSLTAQFKTETLQAEKQSVKPDKKAKTSKHSKSITYKVKSGDNLTQLAKKYHTSVEAIVKANNKKNKNIRIGEKLIIPAERQ
jgi:LysM repeat protein